MSRLSVSRTSPVTGVPDSTTASIRSCSAGRERADLGQTDRRRGALQGVEEPLQVSRRSATLSGSGRQRRQLRAPSRSTALRASSSKIWRSSRLMVAGGGSSGNENSSGAAAGSSPWRSVRAGGRRRRLGRGFLVGEGFLVGASSARGSAELTMAGGALRGPSSVRSVALSTHSIDSHSACARAPVELQREHLACAARPRAEVGRPARAFAHAAADRRTPRGPRRPELQRLARSRSASRPRPASGAADGVTEVGDGSNAAARRCAARVARLPARQGAPSRSARSPRSVPSSEETSVGERLANIVDREGRHGGLPWRAGS